MDNKIKYYIDQESTELGLKFQIAIIKNLKVSKKNNNLEKAKKNIYKYVKEKYIYTSNALFGYKEILKKTGNEKLISSPELLTNLVFNHGKLPNINTVVDSYNLISLKHQAVISAHDLDKTNGDIRLIRLKKSRFFNGIGSSEKISIPIGDFGVCDDNHMMCHLNCKQSSESSIQKNTRNILLYIQGNAFQSESDISKIMDEVCDTLIKYNGGYRDKGIINTTCDLHNKNGRNS